MSISLAVDNSHRTCYQVIYDLLSNNHKLTPKQLEFKCEMLACDFTKEHFYKICMNFIKDNQMRSRLDTDGYVRFV